MNIRRAALFLFLPCIICAACASTPSGQPTSLQVTRVLMRGPAGVPAHTWTITDAQAVQQLFTEVQNLPAHHNKGADLCIAPLYAYHLNFLDGTKSIEKDDLYTYCVTLTAISGRTAGQHYDLTPTFNTELGQMLNIPADNLTGIKG